MTTPAQKAGIVMGKSYKVTATEAPHYDGGVYELTRDDGSDLPYFQLVPGFDGPQDKEACIWVNGIAGTVLTEVKGDEAEPVSIHVSLNGNSTTIVVQRNLTADEVAAVLKAINAA